MKTEKPKSSLKNLEPPIATIWFWVFCFFLTAFLSQSTCLAVNSKITRHSTSVHLQKGKAEDVIISSRGNIQLGRAAEVLVEKFEKVWSINSIVLSGGTVFIGTSPNGGVYKYSLKELTKIYPLESEQPKIEPEPDTSDDSNESNGEPVETEQYLTNEHIFAMATDVSGRLLVGISGKNCRLMRYKAGKLKTVYEPNDAKYIFAITVAENGNIYLGTGPEGKIYKLDSFAKKSELLYDSPDKNILSLAVAENGYLYAGSDSRGLVYKINPRNKTAAVLYDSEQQEITALLLAENSNLYAAATSAKIVKAQAKFAAQLPLAGRPETPARKKGNTKASDGGLKLKIANTKKTAADKTMQMKTSAPKPASPTQASYIYKITDEGFVTDIFEETAVFFCLAQQNKTLLVGTGNKAQLFAIEPEAEQHQQIYADKQASQITSIVTAGNDIYIGTANPAKLLKLNGQFALEGTYASDLIDAGQPAEWGKLQIDADIPKGCKILVASRSGNVKDINDPTFSQWTEPIQVTKPIQLRCPNARFCQYKLILQSPDAKATPVIREIAAAHTVPNQAPKLEAVAVAKDPSPGKKGILKISYKASDSNKDKLIYKIDFRKITRTKWIQLKEKVKNTSFEWDGRTVEDGRYEVRITVSDELSNTAATKLTSTRISEPVVVDNTPPVIKKHSIKKEKDTTILKLQLLDELSAIGKVNYTINSNDEWIGTLPDDLVYDTTEENFTIEIENLDTGEHIISVRIADDLGNTTYKTFEVVY
jgi:hypothetical protein